jgi:hypothetical protein
MEDAEFLRRMRERIQQSTGRAVELVLGEEGEFALDLAARVPRVVMGKDVLQYAGKARMLTEYVILCLKQGRQVPEQEFQLFLRRN